MPELTYFVATSLDGRIADPKGDFSAFPAEGDHLPHIFGRYPETLPVHAREALGIEDQGDTFDTVVMGWNTFAVALDEGIDSPYPHLRQIVFSRRDRAGRAGDDVEVCADSPVDVVDALRAGAGTRDIWLCGGGNLAGELFGSIDRLLLKINPIVLGAGISLIGGDHVISSTFELAEPPVAFDSGVILADYRRR